MCQLIEVADETFQENVLNANGPVVVDFWGIGCRPCVALLPWLEEVALDFSDVVRIVKANVETNAKAVAEFNIRGLPTLLLFVNGKEVSRENFAASRQVVRDWIVNAIGFERQQGNS